MTLFQPRTRTRSALPIARLLCMPIGACEIDDLSCQQLYTCLSQHTRLEQLSSFTSHQQADALDS